MTADAPCEVTDHNMCNRSTPNHPEPLLRPCPGRTALSVVTHSGECRTTRPGRAAAGPGSGARRAAGGTHPATTRCDRRQWQVPSATQSDGRRQRQTTRPATQPTRSPVVALLYAAPGDSAAGHCALQAQYTPVGAEPHSSCPVTHCCKKLVDWVNTY